MIWLVIWVVLMLFWLFYGGYNYDRNAPSSIGNTLIPWFCTLILGLILFGAVRPPPQ